MFNLLWMLTNDQDSITAIQYTAYSTVGRLLSVLADAQLGLLIHEDSDLPN